MVLNVITFVFVVFHAVTWFNLAPKAMVVHLGGKRLPGCSSQAPTTRPGWSSALRPLAGEPMMAKRSIEPFVWMLFSVGGVVAAVFVPVLVFLFGLAYPLGWLAPPSHAHLVAVVGHPLVRVLLFCPLHAAAGARAHRFRYTLYDGLQLQHLQELILLVSYGGAFVGSVAAGVLLWQFG